MHSSADVDAFKKSVQFPIHARRRQSLYMCWIVILEKVLFPICVSRFRGVNTQSIKHHKIKTNNNEPSVNTEKYTP